MKKVNRLFLVMMLMTTAIMAKAADNATTILDKAAATYTKSGDVKIGFTIAVNGQSSKGQINLSGQKFLCSTGGSVAWFDGKTMWHYVKNNEEVNITNPSDKEIARMNPYHFLNIYKKGNGYKSTVKKTTATEYHILLTGKKGSTYNSIEVHLNKSTYQLSYVKLVSSKRTAEITVNSYLKNQKFPASMFTFNKKEYPSAEIVDLR